MENQASKARLLKVMSRLLKGAVISGMTGFVLMRFVDLGTALRLQQVPEATKTVFEYLSFLTEPSKVLTAIAIALVLAALLPLVAGATRPALSRFFGFMLASCLFVLCVVFLVKVSVGRARPLIFSSLNPFLFNPFSGSDAFESFPSAQAAIAAAVCHCVIFRLPEYRLVALTLMIIVGLSRVIIERHWISDVAAGWVVGWAGAAMIGALFFEGTTKRTRGH